MWKLATITALIFSNPIIVNHCLSQTQETYVSLTKIIFNSPPPPSRGKPGNTEDLGSRGDHVTIGLKALVPTQQGKLEIYPGVPITFTHVWGLTTQEYPTFWFYIPPLKPGTTLEFTLQDNKGTDLYQENIPIPEAPGIISISVPKSFTPLEEEDWYQYYLHANLSNGNSSYVRAWVQRTHMDDDLVEKLAQATPWERVKLYGKNGIWYDMLGELVQLYGNNLEEFQASWRSIFDSIEMSEVGDYPIVD